MNILLPTRAVEKVWGLDELPAPFKAPEGKRVGEIWFEPPAELPELLVKYIFASEKLSIQTHPSDAQTEAMGLGSQGKEECWLILDAKPGAAIAAGFKQSVDSETLRAAALDGSIEEMLDWHPVKRGDFFYIPANTVHAIGGGVSLLEVQQNSDITYRLFDYGRPRELHLEKGMSVAKGEPFPETCRTHIPETFCGRLVDGPYFTLDRIVGIPDVATIELRTSSFLAIPVTEAITVRGTRIKAGECALATTLDDIEFDQGGTCYLAQPIRP